MSMLPIFLKLAGRRCLLVGAGNVALEKIGSLLKTGVNLRVIAPEARPEVRQLATAGKLEWVERAFEAQDLGGTSWSLRRRILRGSMLQFTQAAWSGTLFVTVSMTFRIATSILVRW